MVLLGLVVLTLKTDLIYFASGALRVLLTPDITTQENYQKRLTAIKEESYNEHYDIAIVGDSLAFYLQPQLLENCCQLSLLNWGVSGDTSSALRARLSLIEPNKADKIYLLIGTNDIGRNVGAETTLKNISAIIDNLNTRKSLSLILIPYSDGLNRNNRKISEMNVGFLELCKVHKIDCLDLNSELSDGAVLSKKFSKDGLHLNRAGLNVMAKVIAEDFKRVE